MAPLIRLSAAAVLMAAVAAGALLRGPRETVLSGRTMGTTWSVRARVDDPSGLAGAVQSRLDGLEALFSTWRPDSEISRFNREAGTDWFPVATETVYVVYAALEVSAATDGALDITVLPLVEAWGFGPTRTRGDPGEEALAVARACTGWRFLETRKDPPALRRSRPGVRVDLSAVAKGHAVDAVVALLRTRGIVESLVEVGGELRACGRPRRVAIESPDGSPPAVLHLEDVALATSGDYRQAREVGGRRASHVIDPRTGRPACSGAASASVLHPSALQADAWATALLVLGADGLEKARASGVAGRVLSRVERGFREDVTPDFGCRPRR